MIAGANIRFSSKAALVLGIAFNELATNAVKYGALSNATGSVLIKWTMEPVIEGSQILLQWQEKDGPPVTPPSHRGFGSRVIERGVAHELEGTVHFDYHSDGLICTMTFPPACRRPRHCIAGSSARIHSAPACSFPERQPLEICRRLVDSSRRSGREVFDQRRASADVARAQSGRIYVTYVVFRIEEGGDASLLFQPQK